MPKRLTNFLDKMLDRLVPGVRSGSRPLPDMFPDSGPNKRRVSTGLHFEALEPRLLLSATGESAAIGAAITTPQPAEHIQFDSQNQAISTDLLHALENSEDSRSTESQASTNPSGNDTQPDPSAPAANPANSAVAGFETEAAVASSLEPVDLLANAGNQELDSINIRHELVVVDGGITNYEQLVSDLLSERKDGSQLEVVVLDPEGDGVAQISDLLAERQDLDALHLVSHGTDRGVKLGDTWLYPENLDDYAEVISKWEPSLTEGADLLFYGCNFAATSDGQALLASFGELTGADVAASIDDTGHALLGGDWELEYKAGSIESDVVFSPDIQSSWSGLLAETVHEEYTTGTDSVELKTSQSWGQTFVNTGSGNYTVNRISVWLMESNSANKDLTVSIRDAWNGTIEASATIQSDLVSAGVFARYDFDIADTTLAHNTTYYLRVDYDSTSGKVFVETDSAGSYAGGALLDNGTAVGGDMKFRIVEVTGNDPPVLTGDLTATVDEAGTYTIQAADLGYTDVDDGDAGVTFTTSAATNGKIQVGGVDASTFTGTQLTAGQVTFVHDGSETVAASFAVNVEDGNEDSSSPANSTFTFTVNAVNDPPVLTGDLAATVDEAGTYTIQTSDLWYTDVDDVDAGVTFTTSAATNGKIQVNSVDATSFTGTQLNAGQVTFVHDGSETTTASFAVNVDDGNEDSSTPANSTFTFTVNAVNDPPVLTGDLAATVDEAGTYTIQTSDLWYTDVDDVDAGVTFTTSAATNGKIQVNSVDATSFTGTQLNAGQVTFVHDGSETTTASFAVNVDDGNEDSSTPANSTFTFTVNAVNDPPVLTSFAGPIDATAVNTQVEITFADLAAQGDEADVDGTVTGFVVKAVSSGTLLIGADAGTATLWAAGSNDTIDGSNNAYWTPAAAASGTLNAFTVVAEDNSGTESVPAIQAQVSVGAANNAPTASGVPGDVTVVEDTASSFDLSSVTITDIDGDSLTVTLGASAGTFAAGDSGGVTIGGSGTGTLTLTGTAAAINTYLNTVTNIQYTGALNATGDNAATFTIYANDGTVNPQVGSGNIDITPVNDAPTLTSFSAVIDTTAEDTQVEITFAELAAQGNEADVDGTVDAFVVKAVSSGTLLIGANAGSAIPWAAGTNDTIDGTNNAYWTPAADATGTLNAFTAVAEDNSGAESATPVQAQVTVTAVNDAPTASNLNAGETYSVGTPLNLTDIVVSDVDSAIVTVTLTLSDPAAGTLSTGTSGAVTSAFAGGVWTATGALGDVNVLLAGTTFNPAGGYTSNFTIATSVDDGIAPAVTGTKNVTFTAPPDPEPPAPIIEETTPDPIVEPEPETEPAPVEEPAPEEAEEAPAEEAALSEEDTGDTATAIPASAAGGAGSAQQQLSANTLRGSAERALQSVSFEQGEESGFTEVRERAAGNQPGEYITSARTASMALGARLTELGVQTIRALDFLENSLDGLKQEAENEIALNQVVASSAIAVTTGLSMGYVAWLLRSGVLLSSLLSSMPAWRFLDPLPVLAGKLDLSEEADEESLETIIEQPSKPTDDGAPESESDSADEKEA